MRGGVFKIHDGVRDNPEINVYRCKNCETKFLDVIDKENDYENGFMYNTNNMSELDVEERLQLFRADDFRRYETVRDICAGKKVLDFGCGFGGFLQYISKVSSEYYGVELGKCERDYLKSKNIQCFRTIDECKDKFNVITLFHTFEHLSNPRSWLDKFSEYLVKGGYLIIEVPNANDILIELYESREFADFTYWSAHLFLYTIKSLTLIINECGRYNILSARQVQRYPISNHLYWLVKGLPGGHNRWKRLDNVQLNNAYEETLAKLGMCDTLFFTLQLREYDLSEL